MGLGSVVSTEEVGYGVFLNRVLKNHHFCPPAILTVNCNDFAFTFSMTVFDQGLGSINSSGKPEQVGLPLNHCSYSQLLVPIPKLPKGL